MTCRTPRTTGRLEANSVGPAAGVPAAGVPAAGVVVIIIQEKLNPLISSINFNKSPHSSCVYVNEVFEQGS